MYAMLHSSVFGNAAAAWLAAAMGGQEFQVCAWCLKSEAVLLLWLSALKSSAVRIAVEVRRSMVEPT